jgi:feruloyl esterase
MSLRSIAGGPNFHKQQLQPQNFIPFTLLAQIDQAVLASCDALDGVKDGLIQNPAACNFNPKSLQCKPGQTTNCIPGFTDGQVQTLKAYFTGARDDDGNVVYPGFTVSDLGGTDGEAAWTNGFFLPGQALPAGDTQPTFDLTAKEPWGNDGFGPAPLGWQFVDHAIRYFVERDPNFNMRDFGGAAIAPLSDATLSLYDRRTEAGDADDPAAFDPFIDKNRKLLVYHGFSDPALTAIRSIQWYEDLAQRQGGLAELQENVRLFLAPGMHHCGGGPGPNSFDTLTALENWVEHGEAPDGIVATKFVNDTPSQGVARTMPLCKFPEQARFLGNPDKASAAEINNAANWTCSPHDRSLLRVGTNGVMAGLGLPQAAEGNDDRRDGDHDRDDRDRD